MNAFADVRRVHPRRADQAQTEAQPTPVGSTGGKAGAISMWAADWPVSAVVREENQSVGGQASW
jgi:hypothetical protein